ncbi:MAG TPA: hypothetical protein DCQ93_07295, partial [Bacteroidetes bacterium]|nr:hypothetical protein [Bacteroidota bacterium]
MDINHMRWILPVVWAGGIMYLSLMPSSEIPKSPWFETLMIDKWVHAFLYFVLAFLLLYAIQIWEGQLLKNALIMIAVCSFYGFLIEVLQNQLTDSRHFEILDWIADTIGAIIYSLIWMRRNSVRHQKKIS